MAAVDTWLQQQIPSAVIPYLLVASLEGHSAAAEGSQHNWHGWPACILQGMSVQPVAWQSSHHDEFATSLLTACWRLILCMGSCALYASCDCEKHKS